LTLLAITTSGDVREVTFGGMKFLLYGIPTARVLEFGDLSPWNSIELLMHLDNQIFSPAYDFRLIATHLTPLAFP
jgi:hypothetical protein